MMILATRRPTATRQLSPPVGGQNLKRRVVRDSVALLYRTDRSSPIRISGFSPRRAFVMESGGMVKLPPFLKAFIRSMI
jgi:hypothetical protein